MNKKNMNQIETGRSMVEMLGVLAIIGVLSVGGIAGYTSAMNKHRANELLNEASKRAVMASSQFTLQGASTASLNGFPTSVSGGVFSNSVTLTENRQFVLSISGVSKAVCEEILSKVINTNIRVFTPKDCAETNTITLTYNDDLSSTAKASDYDSEAACQSPFEWCNVLEKCQNAGDKCGCESNYECEHEICPEGSNKSSTVLQHCAENKMIETCYSSDGSWDFVVDGFCTNHKCNCEYTNYCLAQDTLITLADGTQKRIDQLVAGDKVLSINPKTLQLEEDEVVLTDAFENKTHTEYDVWTFSDGTVVKTVHPHRFYNIERQKMVYMSEWQMGEHAYTQKGRQVALVSHENIKEEVHHYTLFTKKWNNYFANGLLSGNRMSIEMKLGQ